MQAAAQYLQGIGNPHAMRRSSAPQPQEGHLLCLCKPAAAAAVISLHDLRRSLQSCGSHTAPASILESHGSDQDHERMKMSSIASDSQLLPTRLDSSAPAPAPPRLAGPINGYLIVVPVATVLALLTAVECGSI